MMATLVVWLERRWYGGIAPAWPLRLIEHVYAAVVRRRRGAYLRGVGVQRAALPVVVVGNLTVGGTGKTPLTLALIEALRARGWRPGVISRGYGRRGAGALRVDAQARAQDVGDEPLLMAQTSGAPVAVARRRIAAAQLLAGTHDVDVLIADDGLQHYALARDLEILVVDGTRGFGNGRLLPAGPLREPIARGADCDFRVRNGGEVEPGEVPMRLVATAARRLLDGSLRPLADFAAAPVHALAGIGHPARFFATLRDLGLSVIEHPLPDHHRFTPRDLALPGDAPILMTSKDAVKCRAFASDRCFEVAVRAELPEWFFDAVHARLRSCQNRGP